MIKGYNKLEMLNNLPDQYKEMLEKEFKSKKRNSGSAYACAIFGFYYLYTGKVGMFFVYLFASMLTMGIAGIIMRIYQLALVSGETTNFNDELYFDLLMKYKTAANLDRNERGQEVFDKMDKEKTDDVAIKAQAS